MYVCVPVFNGKVDGNIIYCMEIDGTIYMYICETYRNVWKINTLMYTKNNMYENSMGTNIWAICATNYERSLGQAEKLTCPGWEQPSRIKQTCNRTHNWSTLCLGKLTSTSHPWGGGSINVILVLDPTYGCYVHSYTH